MSFNVLKEIKKNASGWLELSASILNINTLYLCLVLNPITVYNNGFLFNCTTMDQASDSRMALK